MGIQFDHSYARSLPGSFLEERPATAPAPRLLALNRPLAEELGLDPEELARHGADWFSGRELPPGAEPIALAYAGHQFGGFSPQLGDGRAHLLGEILTPGGQRFDLQLKGSGRTAFSRGGDGKAALGPMLREYLISRSHGRAAACRRRGRSPSWRPAKMSCAKTALCPALSSPAWRQATSASAPSSSSPPAATCRG